MECLSRVRARHILGGNGTGGDGERWTFPAIESFLGFLQSQRIHTAHGFLTKHRDLPIFRDIHREISDMLAAHAGIVSWLG